MFEVETRVTNLASRVSPSSRNWSCLGGGKVWGPCVILIGLMPTSYNATHSHRSPFPSIFHPLASVFFSHPCCYDHWAQPQWPATLRRFKRENGIIRKVFPRQFLRPRHREAFHEFSFAKTISCCANASSGTFEYLSVSWVYSFLLISPIFSWREGRVFLVRFCSSMRVTGKLRIVFRDLFRALQREREYIKNFSRDWERRIEFLNLSSFYLQYRVTNSIVYNYHTVNQKITSKKTQTFQILSRRSIARFP